MDTTAQMWTILLVGIGIVFTCLVSLVAMISVFRIVLSPKKTVRTGTGAAAAQAPATAPQATARPAAQAAAGIEPAVIAAIMAAVAAARGVPVSTLRLASVEKAGFNTPAWGHIDRA